ncbi:MAG TPA: CusA/CzcA family heavy metal efflux RND transporter [Burkholderiaceae bacterium]|nr:CusA/CzcA family heavy metal efflux RND transporter [Burkholderiaceae bacterium]
MLATLIDFSLRQRLLVVVAALGLALAGAFAYLNLPIDAFPDISPTQVKVILKVPGMTPEEVEQRVATPIEIEMLGIPSKRMVRSVSKYGIADITIDFLDGTDVYWARQQVSERLAGTMRDLPPGTLGGLAPITTPLGEMFMFSLEGDGYSLAEKRSTLDWVLRPALRTLPGVADINALGGLVRTFEVAPNPALLAARGVTLAQLKQALEENNRNDGAGRVQQGEEALVVRLEGSVGSLEDLRRIVVAQAHGAYVTVGDVATVRVGSATRNGAVSIDGKGETVQGLVLGLRGANARQVVDAVKAKLEELAPRLPPGMTVKVFYDRGQLVGRAANTIVKALVEATLLVCVLLYLFLGGLRAALAVALSLPLSALAAFLLMRYAGLSANLMSLGGLAIAIGMLVDAAVVVVENIASRLSRAIDQQGPLAPLDTRRIIGGAVREVATPVISGIAVIVIVFLPLLTLEGLEGKLFAPVALTIVFALGASLLLAFTLVPALASLLLRMHGHDEPWLMRKLNPYYAAFLAAAFRSKRSVIALAAFSLLLAGVLFTLLGKSFMPTMDEGDLIVQLQKLPSIGLPQTVDLDLRVQRALLEQVPEIRSIVARSGSDDLGLDPMGLNETDSFLVLKPKAEWRGDKEHIAASIRKAMLLFPGVNYSFTQPIEMRISEMLTGTRGDLAIKVFGHDLAEINRTAQQLADKLGRIGGAQDVLTVRNEGVQYLTLNIDRAAAGRAGFSVDALQARLRAQIEGETVGLVLEPGMRTPLVLRGADDVRNSAQALETLTISAPDGNAWPLARLAAIRQVDGPVRIDHENGMRFAVVQANVEGRDLVGFVEEAQALVGKELALPQGMRLEWGGQFENQQRAAKRLALVVPAALIAIFVLLTTTFGSARDALLIFANIPFAVVGGVVTLWLSGQYMSVPASVGFIALLGIAVLNGVVMVGYFRELLALGLSLPDAVRQGAQRRLRPVLMTACITALGMLPLLFASGPGSEIQKPLAIVVIGGLVSSTLLTLILLPILFERFGAHRKTVQGEHA